MRMLRRRRQRTVLRRPLQGRDLALQLRNPRHQTLFASRHFRQLQPNDRLRLRRLAGDDFVGDLVHQHARDVADLEVLGKTSFTPSPHRGVNGFHPIQQEICDPRDCEVRNQGWFRLAVPNGVLNLGGQKRETERVRGPKLAREV